MTSVLLVATGKRQKRDRGVNIFLRRSFGEAGAEPVVNNLPGARRSGKFMVAVETKQADAMCPFPSRPAFCVNHAPVRQALQELTAVILNSGEAIDQFFDKKDEFRMAYFLRHSDSLVLSFQQCAASGYSYADVR